MSPERNPFGDFSVAQAKASKLRLTASKNRFTRTAASTLLFYLIKNNTNMAEFFDNMLTCKLCLDTFKDPVTLGCDHSFCLSCLQKNWDQNKTENCPVCRRSSSKDHLVVNQTLKEMSDSFTQRQKNKGQNFPLSEDVIALSMTLLFDIFVFLFWIF
uniref:RING-type domain-containing protein n=1 Tax=Neogobius melanostomus TaxID=47308 RepID=A0A8C6T9C9_9GOBI